VKFKILSKREESIAEKIADAPFTLHKVLGSGLLEILFKQMNFEKIFILTRIWHIKCNDGRWCHLRPFCWVSLIAQKRLASRLG
jgi:hypothetical protein